MTRFFITGAAGFIGSNLVHHIMETRPQDTVLSYDALTYAGLMENLAEVMDNPRHEFLHGDIADGALLRETLERFQPDAILHLAAETHVDRSITAAQPFIQSNVVGHTNLLMAAQDYQGRLNETQKSSFRFIHISTDEVFGALEKNDPKFCEETPYNPSSPYSASKAASDHLVRAWHKTYGLQAIILNCSNNYGPRQFPEKLIPVVIKAALEGCPIPVYGQGENIRDWLHVSDHCRAILSAAEKGSIGRSYCIGGGNEWRNIDLVMRLCLILDDLKPRADKKSYTALITSVTDRPGHDFRYAIDSARAQKELDWTPEIDMIEGLTQTVLWYVNAA